MRRNKPVWVERVNGSIVRIFHSIKCDAFNLALKEDRVSTCPRYDATAEIRHTIWLRSKGSCELCGCFITETGINKFEMHEKVWRGQRGPDGFYGDISLDNSVAACKRCHRKEHEARSPRFGESLNTGENNEWLNDN